MKKIKKFLIFSSFSGIIFPLIAVSCGGPTNSQNNQLLLDKSQNNATGKINPLKRPKAKLLTTSQLGEIKNSFSYTLTNEGKKLPREELMKILQKIRADSYPIDRGITSKAANDPSRTFENVKANENFKKYLSFTSTLGNLKYLSGHVIEMEFVLEGLEKKQPAIRYSVKCLDIIVNGKMNTEATEYIYLDLDN
ncbi:hypothetical protein ACWXVQ_00480 [Mycoplasma sp. 527]